VPPELLYVEEPSQDDRAAIAAPLFAYNQAKGPPPDPRPLVLLLRDEHGHTAGGLWGKTVYDWLYVELLSVPESMRGKHLGADLMHQAEEIARQRGCVGAWLDTFAFQARAFYEKLDYQTFGELADHPLGSARYFLMKRFS
jgi:GNAT superfamily N-acetyltransferase